ncbi:MAG: phenylacetic acid degradation b [Alphaproteobacteria bacterium]|nr:phenylacetic acid degradation b [Alphaproteobacteria bacterium]
MTENEKRFDRKRERGGTTPRYYEVFARKSSADPLTHVGSVEAPNDDLAQVRAWFVYDQHAWKEMCVVPTDAIVTVTEHGKSAKIKMN